MKGAKYRYHCYKNRQQKMIRGLNPTAREAQYNDQQVEYYRKIVE
jgi:hypothetical protein